MTTPPSLEAAESCEEAAEATPAAMVSGSGSGRFPRLDASRSPISAAQVIEIAPEEASSDSVPLIARRGLLFSSKGSSNKERKVKVSDVSDSLDIAQAVLWFWSGSRFSGLLCMGLSTLTYSFMSLLVEISAVHTVPTFEIIFIRFAVVLSASFVLLKLLGIPLLGSSSVKRTMFVRSCVGFAAMCGFLYSIRALAIPDATLLSFTSPLLASIIARMFLKERIKTQELAGTICSCLGLLLALRPTALFGGPTQSTQSGIEFSAASLVALVAAFLGGLSHCLVRYIGKNGESPLVVVFTFALICCPAAAVCSVAFEKFVMPSALEFTGMVFAALLALVAQLLSARGLQLEKVSRAMAIQYIEVCLLFCQKYPARPV